MNPKGGKYVVEYIENIIGGIRLGFPSFIWLAVLFNGFNYLK
jgi:hypothetical protein